MPLRWRSEIHIHCNFFRANQQRGNCKFYSLTQRHISLNGYDWQIDAGNEKRIVLHSSFLTIPSNKLSYWTNQSEIVIYVVIFESTLYGDVTMHRLFSNLLVNLF